MYTPVNSAEKNIHRLFEVSIILKGVHALIEIVGAFVVLFISQSFLQRAVSFLTQEELSEDSKDIVSNYLVHAAANFSIQAQYSTFLYLILHGAIKVFLVAGLLKKKVWAYPATIASLAIFIVYQTYKYTLTQSLSLLALTIFDIIVIALVWHEYKFHYKHIQNQDMK